MEMVKVNPESCCGCSACAAVCSRDAIEMIPDNLGFLYPQLNEEKCIHCGVCEKVCPFNTELGNDNQKKNLQKAYAVRHKDESEVESSRSGAAFIAITDRVLDNGGVVYGAGFGNHFCVVHKRASSKKQRDEFKGSKYAQSDLRGILRLVLDDLRQGLYVVFSGTPCQTAAVRNFVSPKYRERLLLIDIICHGVASPNVWDNYLKTLEKKEDRKLVAVDFRDKRIFGWSGLHRESFTYAGGRHMTYSKTFYQPFLIRRSCNYCPYATCNRPSDLTLGDFWGWRDVVPEMNRDDKGLSLVLCHTEMGLHALEKARVESDVVPVSMASCMQPNLQRPTDADPMRDAFEVEYSCESFDDIYNRYFREHGMPWLKWCVKSWISRLKQYIELYANRDNNISQG